MLPSPLTDDQLLARVREAGAELTLSEMEEAIARAGRLRLALRSMLERDELWDLGPTDRRADEALGHAARVLACAGDDGDMGVLIETLRRAAREEVEPIRFSSTWLFAAWGERAVEPLLQAAAAERGDEERAFLYEAALVPAAGSTECAAWAARRRSGSTRGTSGALSKPARTCAPGAASPNCSPSSAARQRQTPTSKPCSA